MSDFGKFISGVVIGGAVGGILGVLLAPSSGAETRKRIADETHSQYKKAEAGAQDIQKQAEKAIEDLQKTGQEVLRKISDNIYKAKEEGEEAKADEDVEAEVDKEAEEAVQNA